MAASLVAAGSGPALASVRPGWHIQARLAACNDGPGDMATTGPGDAWVEGTTDCSPGGLLVNQWDGHAWTLLPTLVIPGPFGSSPAIAATSARDIFVFPDAADGSTEVITPEHWNGVTWSATAPVPGSVTFPYGAPYAFAFSAFDVWLSKLTPHGSVAYRYDGSTWRLVKPPAQPDALAGVSASDVWAVGPTDKTALKSPARQVLIAANWTGRRWRKVPLPRLRLPRHEYPEIQIAGAASGGPADLWVVCGFQTARQVSKPGGYLLHWNGDRWLVVRAPAAGPVVLDGHGGVWMSGAVTRQGRSLSVVYHYSPGHRWIRDVLPIPAGYDGSILELSGVPHSRAVWAVGLAFAADGNEVALADRYTA
jgi:hypothetical protein